MLSTAGPFQQPVFQLHQALRRKADHLTQQIGIGVFSTSVSRFIMPSVIAGSSVALACRYPVQPEDCR
ncbi:hypothetical protein XI03_19995 [Bradyrhizobium sp. CCBAU 65884]|nr:hypothetical protein [Bradyrhizobium sp. CCBAU 65884]